MGKSNEVDYTKLSATKLPGLMRCPHCGRTGQGHHLNGRDIVFHKEREWSATLGIYETIDWCVRQPDGRWETYVKK